MMKSVATHWMIHCCIKKNDGILFGEVVISNEAELPTIAKYCDDSGTGLILSGREKAPLAVCPPREGDFMLVCQVAVLCGYSGISQPCIGQRLLRLGLAVEWIDLSHGMRLSALGESECSPAKQLPYEYLPRKAAACVNIIGPSGESVFYSEKHPAAWSTFKSTGDLVLMSEPSAGGTQIGVITVSGVLRC